MRFAFLVDFAVTEFISAQSSSMRARLRDCLLKIWNDPSGACHYQGRSEAGRPMSIHHCHRFAIEYWIDHADKEVKITAISEAA